MTTFKILLPFITLLKDLVVCKDRMCAYMVFLAPFPIILYAAKVNLGFGEN